MKFRKLILGLIIIATFALSGCSAKSDSVEPGDYYGDEYSNEDTNPVPPANEVESPELNGGDVVASADVPALLDRKIIYTAGLTMSSPNPEIIYNGVIEDLDTYTAYIESANITSTKYVVKIRVLSVNFTDFVEAIKTTGDVVSFTKSSEDVTNAYSTFEARKLALEAQHDRIVELIAEAVDLQDILTLEDARFDVVTELNAIGESLANFDSLVDYSTINLTINKTTEQVVVLPQTTAPQVIVREYSKNTASVEVTNRSDLPVFIYLDVIQNGEFLRQYEGEAFPDGTSTFEISDLKSDTRYTFRVSTIAADQRESNYSERSVLTESTFFNKVGNVFVGSFDVLVVILEFLGLAVVAIAPFGIAFAIVFIPARILYIKYGRQYVRTRKAKKDAIIEARLKERYKREAEITQLRYQQQREAQQKQQQKLQQQEQKAPENK